MNITLDSLQKATKQLATENSKNEGLSGLEYLFADDIEKDDEINLDPETPKDEEPSKDEGDDKGGEEETPVADALGDLKEVALDAAEDEVIGDEAEDLDDEDTVLDLSSGKKDDEDKEEGKEDEKPEADEKDDKKEEKPEEDEDKEDEDKKPKDKEEKDKEEEGNEPADECNKAKSDAILVGEDEDEEDEADEDEGELNRYEMGWSQADHAWMVVYAHDMREAEGKFEDGEFELEEPDEDEECKKVKVHVYNIEWDTEDGDGHWDDDQPLDVDDEDDKEHWDDDQIEKSDLPTEVDLEVEVCPGDDLSDVIGDTLSDEYDFLVKGFNFDVISDDDEEDDEEETDECVKESNFTKQEVFDYIADDYDEASFEQIVRDLVEEFGMSEEEAMRWIDMWEDEELVDESALGDAFKSIGQGLKGILHSTLKGAAVLIAGLGGSFLFGLPGLLLAVCIAFGLMSAKESAQGVEVDEGLLGGVKDKLKTVLGVLKADPKKSKELNDKMLAAKKAGDKEAMKKIAGEVKALAGNGGKTPPDGGKEEEGDAVQVAESRYERNIVDARPQGDKVTLVLRCPQCGETKEIEVTSDEYDRLADGDGHIQDILPDVSPDDREMFLSGFCSKCWNAMFGGPEEEDDEEVEVGEGDDCCECDVAERHGEFKRSKFKKDKWGDGHRGRPNRPEDDLLDPHALDLVDDEEVYNPVSIVDDEEPGDWGDMEYDAEVAEDGDDFKDGPAKALKSIGIEDPEKASEEDLEAAKALLGIEVTEDDDVCKDGKCECGADGCKECGTKDVTTVAEMRTFLRECNTFKKNPRLRKAVSKFTRLMAESPSKAQALVDQLDHRFKGKPVTERRFCETFVKSI